ncbi:Olfactory receptor 2T27 [Microtus ochrogaster]|uniref:Olfactory receptor 2T27 n=1 Tax=Microtus ochrogaster TaxID=79684 RepID=A0A8J6G551_MICOH|nr:Olfactory receptor 2T27 [Microtus ochrogaster]
MPLGVKNGVLWESHDADRSWEPTVLGHSTVLSFKEDWILLKWSLTVDDAMDLATRSDMLNLSRAAQQEMDPKHWNYSTAGFVLTSLFNNSQTHLFLFSMVVLVYILAMAGNTAMVLLIWMDTRLHTPMYFLLSQLSFLDVFFTSVTVPKMIVGFLFGWTSISFGGCGAQMFFFMFLGAAECLLLALMAYDRYVAICNPLRYPVLMSRRVCLLMVVSSWLGGSLNASIQTSLTLQFPYCGSRKISHFFCEVPSLLMLACADTEAYKQVLFVTGVVVLLVPITFITTSYALILAAVLRMRSVEGRQKALATCSSHLTVVNLFYGPLVYTYMLPASYHSPGQDDVVSVFYTVLTPMLNPVIYSLRNKEVTGAMKKAMGRPLAPKKQLLLNRIIKEAASSLRSGSDIELTDKWVKMQTARRLFSTKDQDMVTHMNTVQETNTAKQLQLLCLPKPGCYPAVAISRSDTKAHDGHLNLRHTTSGQAPSDFMPV